MPHPPKQSLRATLLLAASFMLLPALAPASTCATLAEWINEGQSWSMGKNFDRMQTQHVRELLGPMFHDQVMQQTWGAPYREMSSRKRASIYKALNTCAAPVWAKAVLATPFSDPPDAVKNTRGTDYQQWQATIENVNRYPWAAWEAKKQQLSAMVQRQEQQRAEWVARAPEREQLAREIQAAQQREKEARSRKAEQEASNRQAMVAKHRNSGPFSGSEGTAYLNALYNDDREALTAYDHMFASGFAGMSTVYDDPGTKAVFTMLAGEAAAQQQINAIKKALPNLTLVLPVAVSYVVYYQRAYPQCMDTHPHVFQRTTEYEWVDRNGFGQVMRSSPAWTHIDTFHINDRFMGVWQHRGSIEQSETQVADFLFGKSGSIRAYDAMLAVNTAMHRFGCDSTEMKTLEANMLRYFDDRMAQVQRAVAE